MTIYSYIAIRNGKEEVRGKVEADDKRSARAQIKQLNLIVKDIWEKQNIKVDVRTMKVEEQGAIVF